MKLYLGSFHEGFKEGCHVIKLGQNLFESKSSTFFPSSQSQSKWHFSQTDDTLRLHDGTHVYQFKIPHEIPEEDFSTERLADAPHNEFEKDILSKGVAQVHRSDPGSIYVTLQNGGRNPTFTILHQSGENWKVIPKKRIKKMVEPPKGDNPVVDVNPEDLLKGTMEAKPSE